MVSCFPKPTVSGCNQGGHSNQQPAVQQPTLCKKPPNADADLPPGISNNKSLVLPADGFLHNPHFDKKNKIIRGFWFHRGSRSVPQDHYYVLIIFQAVSCFVLNHPQFKKGS